MFNHLAGMLYYDGMLCMSCLLLVLSSDNLGTSASLFFFSAYVKYYVSKRLIQITQVLCLSFSFWQSKEKRVSLLDLSCRFEYSAIFFSRKQAAFLYFLYLFWIVLQIVLMWWNVMMEQSSLVLKNSSRARCYSSSVFGFIAYRFFVVVVKSQKCIVFLHHRKLYLLSSVYM